MSVYRSEPMSMCQLILTDDVAFNCMAELGDIGLVNFKDLNKKDTVFKRKFYNEVKRCENLERQMKYLMSEMKKKNIQLPPMGLVSHVPPVNPRMLAEYETRIEKLEREVRSIESSIGLLTQNYTNLTELKHLLRKTQTFFDEVDSRQQDSRIDQRTDDSVLYKPSANSLRQHQLPNQDYSTVTFLSGNDREVGAALASKGSAFNKQDNAYTLSFKLNFIAGVLPKKKMMAFERMLFRVCHSNVLLKYVDVQLSVPNEYTQLNHDSDLNKTVFLIFFQGEQLKSKVLKMCEGFHATIYPCPETRLERRNMALGVMSRLEDLNIVLKQTQDHQLSVLRDASRDIQTWTIGVHKTKAIYHQLNKLRHDKNLKTLFGRCWCPTNELNHVQNTLYIGTEKSGMSSSSAILHSISTSSVPPTYHAKNQVTGVFQAIINAYSIPAYMEINPAPFSIITFPFLFSLMFGDLGHGFLLALFGLFLIVGQKKFPPALMNNEIFRMGFTARYLILLMGTFSMYSGIMYNDCFAKPLNLFGSSWSANNMSMLLKVWLKMVTNHLPYKTEMKDAQPLDPVRKDMFSRSPYTMGMDPTWQMASNKISWLNSYKMKISVIFGVLHMLFGVLLSLMNHLHFKRYLNIICLFVPQVIFLCFTFGYLIVLIIHKWCFYDARSSNSAPSLLIGFINMFLFVYPTDPPHAVVGHSKKILQISLILFALICVPWMLFIKPYVLNRREEHNGDENGSSDDDDDDDIININHHDNHQRGLRMQMNQSSRSGEGEVNSSSGSIRNELLKRGARKKKKEFSFGEVFINSCIHTIEYCLGCISHTASYLRLWALSLAHAQLSDVLWGMVLHQGLTMGGRYGYGYIFLFLFFTPWAVMTTVILLAMEGLSAFLHTLRLHWIEFMSKFFIGGGRAFDPFMYRFNDLNDFYY
ncbi:hypothetical protein HELRODRAFT_187007 [Helobdella robusta]|uniref:V-type proton ATPase subunit a n=1 Tax=Helobdella robusta TaxID=6412 RepID=T1FP55_HELRO|nr:hypothetical protein HELRODRAFT_187007 [Helobdella robusta]ESO04672.1 hypothetical protein HELRODRAFT_187007 [Helobdella robusta]